MCTVIKLNWKFLCKRTTAFVGAFYAFLGLIGTFVPLDEIMPADKLSIWIRMGISVVALLIVWILVFLCVSCYFKKQKRYVVAVGNSGHKLYVQYGNLFSKNEVDNPEERRNIIIPVNRCFDIKVDNKLISETSLHGKTFKMLYEAKKYDENTLNEFIQKTLSRKTYEDIPAIEKPEGNTRRYPVGTVVDLPGIENEHYFLLALSTFDSNLKAHTSMSEYALAIQKMIEACNAESEGFPVLIPLMGSELSRIKKNQLDILEYLIKAFQINRQEINCDIHIVVWPNVREQVSIIGL